MCTVDLVNADVLASVYGSSSSWFQTSRYCRAERNSEIINTLEYIKKFPKPFLNFCVLFSATAVLFD